MGQVAGVKPRIRCTTVLFDWNGTLLNDLPLVYESVKNIFAKFGLAAPTLDEYRAEMSYEWMSFYKNHGIPQDITPEDLNTIRRKFLEKKANWDSVELHSRALEVLYLLRKKQKTLILFTGEVREVVARRLRQFGIEHLFAEQHMGVQCKPEVIQTLGLVPHETVYIDDDPRALRNVKDLGFITVGMTHGYASSERIRAAEPDFVFDDFGSMVSLLRA